MNYSNDFKDLVFGSDCPNFIGWGNPNAKILLLGKEPAIDISTDLGRLQYETEVLHNKQDWRDNIANKTGFDEVFEKYSKTRLYGNPLYPHCWQKYQVKNRRNGILPDGDGTSRTWYQYQKLIDMIIEDGHTRYDNLDFHKYCFSTDLSDCPALNSRQTNYNDTNVSAQRRWPMFLSPFFSSFPIVIAAIGNYRNYHFEDWDCFLSTCFAVDYKPIEEAKEQLFSVHVSSNENPRIVVTCKQLSAAISDEELSYIAGIVESFADKHRIMVSKDQFAPKEAIRELIEQGLIGQPG